MRKYVLRSAQACPGSASASTRPEIVPPVIHSTSRSMLLHRAARCMFSPRRKTSRLLAIHGHCGQRVLHDCSDKRLQDEASNSLYRLEGLLIRGIFWMYCGVRLVQKHSKSSIFCATRTTGLRFITCYIILFITSISIQYITSPSRYNPIAGQHKKCLLFVSPSFFD